MIAKRRTDEAVSRKCEEFRRASKTYRFYMQMWMEKADIIGTCRGKRAYAYKQADMWKRKAERIEAAYEATRRPGVPSNQLDHTRVRIVSPSTTAVNTIILHLPRSHFARIWNRWWKIWRHLSPYWRCFVWGEGYSTMAECWFLER